MPTRTLRAALVFIGGLLIRWGAHAVQDAQVRSGPLDLLDASVPEVAACGFYLASRPGGFVLHMSASAAHVQHGCHWPDPARDFAFAPARPPE